MRSALYHLLCISIILFFSAASGFAGETDNYYAWEKDIADAAPQFNTYLNDHIQKILHHINQKKKYCSKSAGDAVALKIMEELGTTWYLFFHSGALNTDMELWAEANPSIDRVPRVGSPMKDYYQKSIYAPKMAYFGIWPTVIDATLNVDGVYFGTDKISHFLGSGYEYYKIYLDTLEKTGSDTRACFDAVKWGVKMENSILGIKTVTVFSYADLEANYQGMLMAMRLCGKNDPCIGFDGTQWILKKPVDFRDYVNPNWDETFNVSAFTRKRAQKVRKNVAMLKLCDKLNSGWVKQKMTDYANVCKDFKEKGFLDTSLSVRLLHLSQRYRFEGLSRNEFNDYSKKYAPGFAYEDLQTFNTDLMLHDQRLYTLEQLCTE